MKNSITIALAGNPNSGKTTVFNVLTGSRQVVGNWPGVTVELMEGYFETENLRVRVVDLPGIYSLAANSEDEKVARNFILSGKADLVVQIIDASNLQRNLYLTTQIMELEVPLILVLNMMDLLAAGKLELEIEHFARHLDCPVLEMTASKKTGVPLLKEQIAISALEKHVSRTCISYDSVVESEVHKLQPMVKQHADEQKVSVRWLTLRLLEDAEVRTRIDDQALVQHFEDAIKRIEHHTGDPMDVVMADGRHGFVKGLVRDTLRRHKTELRDLTDTIDKFVLNRYLGIPLFLLVMMGVFYLTMSVGSPFIDFFDGLMGTIFVDGFRVLLTSLSLPVWLITLLADGLGGGVQTVSTFIPPIFFIFLALSVLEDSGYMSRAAFVMDRFMRTIGLPGKAFIPMLIGFGCNVPAIMATRTLENNRDRILTIIMNPFMSCGARLPVYSIFVAAFFSQRAGLTLFSIYFTGVVLAIFSGLLFKSTILKGEISTFVMELPPYHIPTINGIMQHTWLRLKSFILRAGQVIIIIVLILSFLNSIGTDGSFGNQHSDKSIVSWIAQRITPVFRPMGIQNDNWPATVGLISGVFAKEAVIGSLDALYSHIDAEVRNELSEGGDKFHFWQGIAAAFIAIPQGFGIISANGESDKGYLTGLVQKGFKGDRYAGFAFILFVLIYAPCVAVIGAIYRETSPGWAAFVVAYLTFLAWIVATLYYQTATFLLHPASSMMWIVICFALFLLFYIILKLKPSKFLKKI
ncbi:MAG: Fe(2+) transporter permease subunit FeoB [Candidatus Cloacimonetes bacterium]|nr:Fe(2+) transporter permease subunit FeoB [Candidatus Cloacimonadota bacterium]